MKVENKHFVHLGSKIKSKYQSSWKSRTASTINGAIICSN